MTWDGFVSACLELGILCKGHIRESRDDRPLCIVSQGAYQSRAFMRYHTKVHSPNSSTGAGIQDPAHRLAVFAGRADMEFTLEGQAKDVMLQIWNR